MLMHLELKNVLCYLLECHKKKPRFGRKSPVKTKKRPHHLGLKKLTNAKVGPKNFY
jgi:hypothetical protein